tara:strand:+ start:81 stop:356 length:276 start_codon:yes stop_codon:yes gene_type:complete
MDFPFTEQQLNTKLFLREFSADVDEMELIWHEDREDRIVSVVEGNGWKFQFDEELPIEMEDGIDITIPKGVVHRVIKGKGPLKIKVFKDFA